MATDQEYKDAARKLPKDRSPKEQGLVDEASSLDLTDVKNLDHAAQETQRYNW